ncbi:MAG: hypothetical protein M1267_04225 [Candidatus Thermoplasmatota archaeon]|nr:hypothetical protein [Candidatus Thermoplasmatota archaeon]
MISITVSKRIDPEDLSRAFSNCVQNVVHSKTYKSGNVEVLNMAGTVYFFRSNDTIGFVLASFYNGYDQKIDFGRVGGGSGIFNIRMGAGDKVEERILEGIKQVADNIGATVS